jgi:hypothetical protein
MPGWAELSDTEWSFGDCVFSVDSLVNMCNAYLAKGKPWFFCEVEPLRLAYSQFSGQIERSVVRLAYLRTRIQDRLRSFGYASSEQMREDVKAIGLDQIPEFSISEELSQTLNALMKNSTSAYKQPPRPIEIGPINEWIETRSEALAAQMNLPLQQRSAFILTPSILQARMGQPTEGAFEPFSIAELLFSDSNGEPAPMPFSSCKAELPASSPLGFCRSVFRRFTARQLVVAGYESASDHVLDILADVVGNEVKRIAQTAVTIQQGTTSRPNDCLVHALEVCGYDASVFAEDR